MCADLMKSVLMEGVRLVALYMPSRYLMLRDQAERMLTCY